MLEALRSVAARQLNALEPDAIELDELADSSSKRCWIRAGVRSRRPSTENCSTAKLPITLPMIIAVRIVFGDRSPA